jgi:hypothetical protein
MHKILSCRIHYMKYFRPIILIVLERECVAINNWEKGSTVLNLGKLTFL